MMHSIRCIVSESSFILFDSYHSIHSIRIIMHSNRSILSSISEASGEHPIPSRVDTSSRDRRLHIFDAVCTYPVTYTLSGCLSMLVYRVFRPWRVDTCGYASGYVYLGCGVYSEPHLRPSRLQLALCQEMVLQLQRHSCTSASRLIGDPASPDRLSAVPCS